MSKLFAEPQLMAAAAADLAAIASTVKGASKSAAGPTAGVLPAGGDEVSAGIAAMFGVHAQAYQAIGAHAAAFHDRFVQALQTSAGAYTNAEAANTSPMQHALGAFSSATQNSTGGPPMGSGTSAGTGAGHAGGGDAAAAHPGNGPAAAAGSPQGDGGGGAMPSANTGGGDGGGLVGASAGTRGLSAGDGGGSSGGAGGSGVVADPAASGGGAGSPNGAGFAGAAGAAGAPLATAGSADGAGSHSHAGLGDGLAGASSGAIGGMGLPGATSAAPAASLAAASSAAAQPDLSLATKVQPVNALIPAHPDSLPQSGNPARAGDPVDGDRDKLPQFVPVPLPRLRGLRKKLQGLRNREEDGLRKDSADEESSRPVTPEDLLQALGLRPPEHEMTESR
jgi:hypothetical protein